MNKADLIEALAPRLGGRAAASAAVEAMVDVVLREVASGGSVAITGFGTFERVQRAPRTGRNPRTGEPVPIAGTTSPRFRPGSYFKDVVADPAGLPAEGSAGVRGAVTESGTGRSGAPASVRRAAGGAGRGDRTSSAAASGGRGQRRATSGTPSSVRKEPPSDAAPVDVESGPAAPAAGGRVFAGGEDITAGMISAKKAELARVKNDQVATKDKKKGNKKKDQGTSGEKPAATSAQSPGDGPAKGAGKKSTKSKKDKKDKNGTKQKKGKKKSKSAKNKS